MKINNVDDLMSIVKCSSYANAFLSMKAYFLYIEFNKIHPDLDTLAVFLYKTYFEYNDAITSVLCNIHGDVLIRTIKISQDIYNDTTESYSLEQYNALLPTDDYEFLCGVFGDNLLISLNVLVGLTKYNALYHRIKDYFVPMYCK
jgi:hypothetical protein